MENLKEASRGTAGTKGGSKKEHVVLRHISISDCMHGTHSGVRPKAEKSLWNHVEKGHEGATDRLIVTWQMTDFFVV